MPDVTWDFTGKVALASGGASGIGRAAAAAWLAAGARVAILDQSAERLEETAAALGAERLLTVCGYVTEVADCERAVDETLRRFGRLDVLLNAAGIGGIGRVWELDPLVWDRVLAVNLRGTFLLTRAATRWSTGSPAASSTSRPPTPACRPPAIPRTVRPRRGSSPSRRSRPSSSPRGG